VSTILDALRRSAPKDDDEQGGDSHSDSVLATLGYPRQRPRRSGLSMKMLLVYGAAAVAIGFVGLSLLIAFLAPPEPQKKAVPAPSRVATRQPVAVAAPKATPPPPAQAVTAPPSPVTPAPATARSTPPPPTQTPPANTVITPAPVLPPRSTTPPPPSATPPAVARNTAPPPDVVPPRVAPSASPAVRSTEDKSALRASEDRPAPRRRTAVELPPEPVLPAPSPVVNTPAAQPQPNHFALALYNQRIGNYDEAMTHYKALLAQNDKSAEVHNNVGLVALEQGRLDEAISEYQKAIENDPKYVRAHNNLGVAYMRSNRAADAAAEFRLALSLDGRNVESLVNLALVQKSAGRPAEARDLLRRALAIDPRSAGSHYNLAVVADESGERASAVEHYRAFLKYGSLTHADLVAPVRARIAALTG
jgi:Tfp pilus assembly protein PilF